MEIVKKNILSIIFGVVALVAVLALFWPVTGMYTDTQSVLDGRKKAYDNLERLRTASRTWPVIPDLESGEKPVLKGPDGRPHFPNSTYIEAGKDIKDLVHKQADAMEKQTAVPNKHDLLVADSLPIPGSRGFIFRDKYREAVHDTLPKELAGAKPAEKTGAVLPVTDEEVHARADAIWNTDYKDKLIDVGGNKVNFDGLSKDWQTRCGRLQGQMQVERAHQCKLYLEPDAINVNRAIDKGNEAPKEDDIWYAQMMLWVQQDLISAIKTVNASAHDVTESPVKRIYHLDVPEDAQQYIEAGNSLLAGPGGAPETPGKAYSHSVTGRICNPVYDVVRFSIMADVDATKIPQILAELQKGKLITVHYYNVTAVDTITAADDGYIYGDVPVVRLTLRGEELFLRDWTTALMPASMRTKMKIAPR